MPIYAYRCAECGHAKDVLQKIADAPLTTCPACGAEAFSKQLTAAGFQLKGSGWYVTDFKGGGAKPAAKSDGDAAPAAKPADAGGSGSSGSGSSGSSGSGSSGGSTPPASTPGGGVAASGRGCGGGCACH